MDIDRLRAMMEGRRPGDDPNVNRFFPDGAKLERSPHEEANIEFKVKRMMRQHGETMGALLHGAVALSEAPLPVPTKVIYLYRISDEISKIVSPLTPCKKGCGHCCNQATGITEAEAKLIADATGRTMHKPPVDMNAQMRAMAEGGATEEEATDVRDSQVRKWEGKPCTFLGADGACTVYDVRPLACRIYYSLESKPDYCDGHKNKGGKIANPDMTPMVIAHVQATQDEVMADIRDFFPPEAA